MSAPGGGRFSSTIFARLFHRFGRYRNNLKLLMLGLDAAGKTTLLHKLKLEEARIETATVGFNLEAIRYRNVTLTMWDVGGQEKIRALWRHYFVKTQGLIFVVDSNDRDRIMEARDELHSLLADSELREAKLLVFANKQDLGKPLDATMVTQFLELSKLQDREWHVQGCSASSGKGLYEGLDWLVSVLQPCSHLPQTI